MGRVDVAEGDYLYVVDDEVAAQGCHTAVAQPDESDAEDETGNWVSEDLLILPQTLEKGKVCLRFTVSGDNEYTFTPNEDLKLLAGKINHLYLGVAFDQLEVILIGNGISITDWNDSDSNNGDAIEQ